MTFRQAAKPVTLAMLWGGQTDLAQALWRVRADRGEAGYRDFVKRFRVYDIADQDRSAERMWAAFPGLTYLLAKAPAGRDSREGLFRGMYLGGDTALTRYRRAVVRVR